MHVDMIESSNCDLLHVAMENTAVSLKSIIAKHESLATYENHLAGDLVNARKCVEMALVSLAALVSDDDLDRTREILSRFGFADIL